MMDVRKRKIITPSTRKRKSHTIYCTMMCLRWTVMTEKQRFFQFSEQWCAIHMNAFTNNIMMYSPHTRGDFFFTN
ncbi:hypothetical protein EA138_03840 [Anoxybacillus flavithermus]|uniref:Uncharacterized protein n=1 Tax=Anoxybacillus flavithermus TaxID=33934 RepID=A0AAX2A306_9BACL|nr:hypothetical protein EA138_03840 [Anoxybacillus flavithermus]